MSGDRPPEARRSDSVLSAVGIRKRFGQEQVLKGVSLDVARGERLLLVGRSGSGKTTLLRCINALETPDEGELYLNGRLLCRWQEGGRSGPSTRTLQKLRQSVGMVFQSFELFANMTALENVCFGLRKVHGMSRAAAAERGHSLLRRVGVDNRSHAYPAQLSGGQQQRVAIARSLAMEPQAILFDEPTSALDPEMVGEVLEVMYELAEAGMTMVIVTHEINFAKRVGTACAVLDAGEVVEYGPAESVLSDPSSPAGKTLLAALSGR